RSTLFPYTTLFRSHGNAYAEFQGMTRFNALQVEYNVVERSAEREFFPMAATLDMAITAWSPLSGGMVTGKYNDASLDPSQTHRLQDPLDPAKHHIWGPGLRRNR